LTRKGHKAPIKQGAGRDPPILLLKWERRTRIGDLYYKTLRTRWKLVYTKKKRNPLPELRERNAKQKIEQDSYGEEENSGIIRRGGSQWKRRGQDFKKKTHRNSHDEE